MPELTGIQVIRKIKKLIESINRKQDTIVLVEPEFIIVTAYVTQTVSNHIKKEGAN
jgi:hypothetical protein